MINTMIQIFMVMVWTWLAHEAGHVVILMLFKVPFKIKPFEISFPASLAKNKKVLVFMTGIITGLVPLYFLMSDWIVPLQFAFIAMYAYLCKHDLQRIKALQK